MTASIEQVIKDYENNNESYLSTFLDFLRIPSVSTDPAYKEDLEHCADWLIEEMNRVGFKNNRKLDSGGHPIVYGEWLEAGDDKPTILVYAHYDVQPIEPLDAWDSPPFEPDIREGNLYARGAIDDKCGVHANLKIFESIFAVDGKLPFNVKLFFEGEEEIGSPTVQTFVENNRDLLMADALILCDGPFYPGQSAISTSARGLIAAEVTIRGTEKDLHSGEYGGIVHNPLHLAGKIIGSFHDDSGKIQIPGFYDNVARVDKSALALAEASWEELKDDLLAQSGVTRLWANELGSIIERATTLPSLDVNGMTGGYQGIGSKTIIPAEASFKVTMRLVDNQDPQETAQLFTDHVMSFTPETLAIEVNILATAYPMSIDVSGPLVEAIIRTGKVLNGKAPYIVRSSASLPIGGTFQKFLGIPMIGLYFGAGANVHAPNEYLNLENFKLAIEHAIHFYYYLAEAMA